MRIAMTLKNALQRLCRLPLPVIGIIAEQHHMANAAPPHLFQRRMQCIGALIKTRVESRVSDQLRMVMRWPSISIPGNPKSAAVS